MSLQIKSNGKIMYQTPDHCFSCINYLGERKCKAFKYEIPDDIFERGNTHKIRHKEQVNEILFQSNIESIIAKLK